MIIDFHTHIFPEEVIGRRELFVGKDKAFSILYGNPKARMVTAQDLMAALDREGVDVAVVCGFPWEDQGLCRMTNEYLMEAGRTYPGRLFPFVTTSLRYTKALVREVQGCLEQGMKGIGEVAFYAKGRGDKPYALMDVLAEVASAFKVPLLLHVNEPVGHLYPGKIDMRLKDIYQCITRHPEARIVLAHWGGGLFFYELMPSVRRMVRNLFYDTAASPFLYRPHIYRIALEIIGPERILFGSDYPLIAPSRYFREMDSVKIPARARKRILGHNAQRLLGVTADNT